MILIADSGSTKTDWRLIDDEKKIHQFSTQGFNPFFQSRSDISTILKNEIPSEQLQKLTDPGVEVFFYGAGCKAEDKKLLVHSALQDVFSSTSIIIESDMLGAARSVCGHQPGLAAILGTGMNTCYYNGMDIESNRTSLGFIMGDEGSGAHLGKTFIQHFLNDELPADIASRFVARYNITKDEIIDAVYKKPMPNRYLASYSKFIYQNLKEQFMIDLVKNCFIQFFDKHILKYPQHTTSRLSCVGSVAFYYSNILRSVAEDKGISIDTIVETPIAGLTLYHLEE